METSKLLDKYTPEQRAVILAYLDKLAKVTRKTGTISESAQAKIIEGFALYDADVVTASLKVYLQMYIPPAERGRGKSEKYVLGIVKNKQAEKYAGGSGNGAGRKQRGNGNNTGDDEGLRLRRLAEAADGGKLDCDF